MNNEKKITRMFQIIYCVICLTLSIILVKNANALIKSIDSCKCYTNNNYNTCYCGNRW